MNDLNYCKVDTNQIDQFNNKFTETWTCHQYTLFNYWNIQLDLKLDG